MAGRPFSAYLLQVFGTRSLLIQWVYAKLHKLFNKYCWFSQNFDILDAVNQLFNQNNQIRCENSISALCCSQSKPKNGNITKARRMVLANSIKSARKAKGLKQAVLARKIGCNQATLSRIESGATSVDVDLLIEICLQLEISAPSLLGALQ